VSSNLKFSWSDYGVSFEQFNDSPIEAFQCWRAVGAEEKNVYICAGRDPFAGNIRTESLNGVEYFSIYYATWEEFPYSKKEINRSHYCWVRESDGPFELVSEDWRKDNVS
jgi:hypothetical protein